MEKSQVLNFWDQSSDDLSAKGGGGLRQMHNYVKINEHLSRHKIGDLYLDTFNYNGHTSVVDSLWAGLPVITKIGNS